MGLLTVLAGVFAGAAILGNVDTEEEDTTVSLLSEEQQEWVKVQWAKYKGTTSGGTRVYQGGAGYVKKEDFDALNVQTVSIPANFAGLEAEMVPTRLQEQLFRISEVVEDEDYVTITARHVWYDNLQNYTLWKPTEETEYTGAAACRNILTNAISPVDSNVASDCTDEQTFKETDFERKNIVECFLDPENGICARYGLSLIRDNWDFYCLKEVGYDRGFVIQNKKNLLGVERTESIENVATRVCPIGKDTNGGIIWMDNNGKKYLDSVYIGDYGAPRVEIYDTGLQVGKDDVTADNINGKLIDAAQARFSEDKVDLPELELKIEFLSLGDTEEYVQYRGLDKVYLYDIVTIKDTVRGYEYSAQVVGIEHDILTGMLNSITLGSIQNSDGIRKIASWQVPEISGENIRLKTILAGAYAPGSIQSDDIGGGVIEYAHFKSATIDALDADAIEAVTAQIHEIIAGSITADDIQAGSITTETLAAGSVTAVKIASEAITSEKIHASAITANHIASNAVSAEKIAAGSITSVKIDTGAVTAEKIGAGAINADKIDALDISAINAKLGTASIADARIALADIDYAKVKDLNAQSAYFGQAVFSEAVGGKLYVPRLMVGYAQMVTATVGDLVIKATNGNYYHLDVNATSGAVTATQVTPTAEEIAQGHTSNGQTIIDTDIVAENLSTANIYATHALMDEINANIISADRLFAREATIAKINAMDLSSNTYIQSVVGDWASGSTITQTINSINTRITSLGYGTFYYSTTEPAHTGLVAGDVWIKPIDSNSWGDIAELTWQDVQNLGTWDSVLGKYEMYCWTGTRWKILYDSRINSELQTQINQNAYAITLKADESVVDELSGDVTEFAGVLEVQAQQISSAVSTVNAKSSGFVQETDPSLTEDVHIGDIWTKAFCDGTWLGVSAFTWRQVGQRKWSDLGGAKQYVWNGDEWLPIADRALLVTHSTEIRQTAEAIEMEAVARQELGDRVTVLSSSLVLTNESIRAEVQRAQYAEDSKIAKTSQYQTADSIVNAAQTYVNGILTSESAIEQTATGITAYVSEYVGTQMEGKYDIVSGVDIKAAGIEISGAKYIKIKSGGSFVVESGKFNIDTDGNVSLNGAITATSGKIAGWNITTNKLYSGSGSSYVALSSDTDSAYSIWAGAETASNAPFWVKRNGTAKFAGTITAASGSTLGGWTLGQNDLHSGSSTYYIALASSGTYAMWAGSETASAAPFSVTFDGAVTMKNMNIVDGQGQTTTISPYSQLWKLNGCSTIRDGTLDIEDGYVKSFRLSNGATLNFKSAASVTLSGGWSGNMFKVTNSGNSRTSQAIISFDKSAATVKSNLSTGTHKTTLSVDDTDHQASPLTMEIDGTGAYDAGKADVTLSGAWSGNTFTVSNSGNDRTSQAIIGFRESASTIESELATGTHKTTLHIDDTDRQATPLSIEIDGTDAYDAGVEDGYDAGVSDGEDSVDYDTESAWSGGYKSIKLTNGKIRYINMPDTASWSYYWVSASVISVTCNVGGRSFTQSFSRT